MIAFSAIDCMRVFIADSPHAIGLIPCVSVEQFSKKAERPCFRSILHSACTDEKKENTIHRIKKMRGIIRRTIKRKMRIYILIVERIRTNA
jgi:hypothetical protein